MKRCEETDTEPPASKEASNKNKRKETISKRAKAVTQVKGGAFKKKAKRRKPSTTIVQCQKMNNFDRL